MKRNGTVEVMRLLGACAILWYHVHAPGKEIGLVAMPLFVAFVVLLQPMGAPLGDLLRKRLRRLVWPWLLWSVIFILAHAYHDRALPGSLQDAWGPWIVGPAIHLWFLPFAFFCSLVVHATDRLFPKAFWAAALLFVLGGLVFVYPYPPEPPWPQWCRGSAALGLALAFRHLSATASPGLPRGLAAAMTVAGLLCLVAGGLDPGTLLLGIGLACLSCIVVFPARPWMSQFGALSMLVYLSHPLVIMLVGKVMGFDHLIALGIMTLLATFAGCLGLLRLRLDRVLI